MPDHYVRGDVRDKWVVVTGASTGIGEAAASQLYRAGANVVLACRSVDKGRAAVERIQTACSEGGGTLEVAHLDLTNGASIEAFAKQYRATHSSLHILINNAGLNSRNCTAPDGSDLCFSSNYLGHFLLTQLLLPILLASCPARIVNVGSVMHWLAKGEFEPLLAGAAPGAYAESKLAMVGFANELAAHLADTNPAADIRVMSADPGFTASDIWRQYSSSIDIVKRLVMLTTNQGCRTTVEAATRADLPSGSYLVPLCLPLWTGLFRSSLYFLWTLVPRLTFGCRLESPSPLSLNLGYRLRLWEASLEFWESHGHAIPRPPSNSSFRRRGWSGCYAEG